MRWVWFALTVVVLLAVAGFAWLQIIYGTFDPCTALGAELQRDVARRAGIPAYVVEQSPKEHNASPSVISRRIEGMSGWECTGRLLQELAAGAPAPRS